MRPSECPSFARVRTPISRRYSTELVENRLQMYPILLIRRSVNLNSGCAMIEINIGVIGE